jgi:hypothetical protein
MLLSGGLDCLGENVTQSKLPLNGMCARGFQMHLQTGGLQPSAKRIKVVHQGFATRDDNDRWLDRFSFGNQVGSKALRMATSIPGLFGVAPGATDIAACQSNEESIRACPSSFALN